jgi:Streptomyces sporulation and cell division protein, SsgA
MSTSRTTVSAELSLGLVGPERTIVPVMAGLHYASADPYAIRMAFHVGTGEPVEWTLARDLLAASLVCRQGIGDVRAWPSAAPEGPAPDGPAAGGAEGETAAGLLYIAMNSPFGQAQFQASAAAIAAFLQKTYAIVPAGRESDFMDFDDELTELLSQSLTHRNAGGAGRPDISVTSSRIRPPEM